ncbi:KH domain-containing protein [Geodermatophilus sp. SYSU D00779]
MSQVDAEVVLDLRSWRGDVSGKDGVISLWEKLEPAMVGRDLSSRSRHVLEDAASGSVVIDVVRLQSAGSFVVGPKTSFLIGDVIMQPELRYRCAACARAGTPRYGPFMCRRCGDDIGRNRLCDEHVRFLDGALVASCDEHVPGCEECGARGIFWCAGSGCRGKQAHCAGHRREHPQEADIAYCPACFEVDFPPCEVAGCARIGSARCEISDRGVTTCGRRICSMHAKRWQIYGGEALGLAVCSRHAPGMRSMSAEEILRRVVVGTVARGRQSEPLPSLRGLAHTLRNSGHNARALDYRWLMAELQRLESAPEMATATAGRVPQRELTDRRTGNGRYRPPRSPRSWEAELGVIDQGNDRGLFLVDRLRGALAVAVPAYGPVMAASLQLAEYKPPRTVKGETRPGLLFVHLDQNYRGYFIGPRGATIRYLEAEVGRHVPEGIRLKLEGDGGRAR